jgi:bifunctional non-homologous end joining protein LigD
MAVKISHPDKVLFPADGFTKADLAAHYETVGEAMLTHVRDRPMNLWRYDRGIENGRVVMQGLPRGAPDWLMRAETPRRKGGSIEHVVANDADALRWLANQNCVTPHVWTARRDRLDRPDRLIFDLDPAERDEGGDPDFTPVRTAALAAGELLRSHGLEPFAMTTGSRGLHVVAPLRRTLDSDTVREAARVLAEQLAEAHPEALTTEWRLVKREGRLLVDTARNTYGQTVVAPYALRALPGAPVATPACPRAAGRCARSAPGSRPAAIRGRRSPVRRPRCPERSCPDATTAARARLGPCVPTKAS